MQDDRAGKAYLEAEEALFGHYRLHRESRELSVGREGFMVRVQSVGSGPPILFIHGNPNAGPAWLPLVAGLPGFRCLLLDRPGCGLSGAASYAGLTPERHRALVVEVIDAVLDAFDLPGTDIVGSSNGSDWSLLYALARPNRVRKLVHEGCPGLIEAMLTPPSMKMMDSAFLLWLVPRLPSGKAMVKSILRQIGHGESIRQGIIPDAYLTWYISLANRTRTMVNEFAYSGTVYRGGKGKASPEFLIRAHDLGRIGHPTLNLWGTDDAFGGREVGEAFTSALGKALLRVFPASGHLPWLDLPEAHARAVADFLREG